MSAPDQLRSRKWAAAAAQFLTTASLAGVCISDARVERAQIPALGVRTQPQSPAHHISQETS